MQKKEICLRVYEDEEVQQAVQELFGYGKFVAGIRSFLPADLYEEILDSVGDIKNSFDFQKRIIAPVLQFIEQISIRKLTSSGLERLDPDNRYLFISNHRDIALDSAFLNKVLFDHGFQTSQIAVGDNLMTNRISELIFCINKSFPVKRTGTARELYYYSMELSRYIHHIISNKIASVWIAQREGRAKDANDRTQVGLLKMLSLSGKEDQKVHFCRLNIVPVAISYEYDPCDVLKTREFLKKQADPEHEKSFQEDLEYMLSGLKGDKGRVHFHFGRPIQKELEFFDEVPNSKKQLELLARLIDKSIHLNYQLHPVNYIAFDLLTGSKKHQDKYNDAEWEAHLHFFEEKIRHFQGEECASGREYLLEMYANPLINADSYSA